MLATIPPEVAGEAADPILASYPIQRVLYDLKFRTLEVVRAGNVTPLMRRITVAGPDLVDFKTEAFDNHVKLFFTPPGHALVLPTRGANGLEWPEGAVRPAMRDYTLRRFDPATGELDLDFVVHDGGPATSWAVQARPGQSLTMAGPRGAFLIPTTFDWHLLVGDETALPAIGRRLEELPAGAKAIALVEIANAGEEQQLDCAADVTLRWLHRDGAPAGEADRFAAALDALTLPPGNGYIWIACEGAAAKQLREQAIERFGQRKEWLKAASYWRRDGLGPHGTPR